MTATFEDIAITLPVPAYANPDVIELVAVTEEFIQNSIVTFATDYEGAPPDMIAWLDEQGVLSEEGRKLAADGAQKVEPGSSVMNDEYDLAKTDIDEKLSSLRSMNDNVDVSRIKSTRISSDGFRDIMDIVDELVAELSAAPGESQLVRWPDNSLHLTPAEEVRLIGLVTQAEDAVRTIVEDANERMAQGADEIYDLIPDLPRNPYGPAPDVGSRAPWTPTASSATWTQGNGTTQDIIDKAVEQLELGVVERRGDNVAEYWDEERQMWVKAPYNINDAWCAAFTTWTWEQAGYNVNWTNPNYVPAIWNDAKSEQMGLAANVNAAAKGDMIIFDWEGDGTPDHVGIVESVGPNGQINTIEGNSGDKLQRQDYQANDGRLVGVVKPPSDIPAGQTPSPT